MKRAASLIVAICIVSVAYADDLQLNTGATGSYLKLKQLQTTGSVLHVVAHPDDEDGAMLAYCARELGVRTMLFSLTRGEGGANLISSHFFDELGALRTLEHAKAASYYGVEVFYSRAADYGYSKTLEEASKQWQNGVPLLEDLVEVIRRERPTILMSRFSGDPRDGHGHHQMAGVLSRRAIEAAADPKQFPHLLGNKLEPWQVNKFYVRAGSSWRPPKEGEWTLELPTGNHDPVIGLSPSQIARFGLGFQRSQGMSGHTGETGKKSTYYRLVQHSGRDKLPKKEYSLFGGLETTWSALVPKDPTTKLRRELLTIDRMLKDASSNWDPREPAATADALLEILKRERELYRLDLSANARWNISRLGDQLYRSIVDIADFKLEVHATDAEGEPVNFVTPGEEITFEIRVSNQGTQPFDMYFFPVTLRKTDGTVGRLKIECPQKTIAPGTAFQFSHKSKLTEDQQITRPHWSRDDIAKPTYQLESVYKKQRALPPTGINFSGKLMIEENFGMDLFTKVMVRRRDPEFGNVRYRLVVVPAKSVKFALEKTVVPRKNASFKTSVAVRSWTKQDSTATVKLELPTGWTAVPESQQLEFAREGEEKTVDFEIRIPQDAASEADRTAETDRTSKANRIAAVVESDGKQYREGFETVTARDLDRLNVYHEAVQQVQLVDAMVAGEPKVGYVAGSGDKVAESLGPLGITPIFLSATDLASGDLAQFDVILIGVRAYAVREDLRAHNSRLMAYVKQGGVLVVQYQTPEFDQNFGPYPYEMGRGPEEVSEELAEVKILVPDHPLFTTPNKIGASDFENWFEQRGSKFLRSWDEKYQPLLECHDTGQPPQQGGQLIARYGNGVYVYSAYAWYRQLPQGVPGAYRLFANMLSLPETMDD